MSAWIEEWLDKTLDFARTPTGLGAIGLAALVYAFCWCRIFARLGLSALLGLFMFVPPFAVLLTLFLAVARWPLEREARALRKMERDVHRADDRRRRRSRAA